jgi:hypothetical protein
MALLLLSLFLFRRETERANGTNGETTSPGQ